MITFTGIFKQCEMVQNPSVIDKLPFRKKREFQGSVCKVVSIQTARTKFPALLCSSLSEFVPFCMPNFGTKPQLVVSLEAEEFVYQKFSKASRGWKSNPVVDSLSQSFSLAKKNSFPTFFPGHTHKIFCPFFNWVPIWWGKVVGYLHSYPARWWVNVSDIQCTPLPSRGRSKWLVEDLHQIGQYSPEPIEGRPFGPWSRSWTPALELMESRWRSENLIKSQAKLH